MYDLTIIVPIYNVEKYIRQAIDSLLNQRDLNYEIILVDDGSKDGCAVICDEYESVSNIKIVHKENGGLPSARKAGLKIAEGKYIGFLDGDDWVDSEYYFNMVKKAMQFKADIVCSSFRILYSDKEVDVNNTIDDGVYTEEKLQELRKRILYTEPYYTYGIAPSLCTKIIKKEWLDMYMMNEPDYITLAEDACCSFPIMFCCKCLCVCHSNKGYHYRQSSQSMSRLYDPEKAEKVWAAMAYFSKVMEEQYSIYHDQIDKFYSFLIKDIIKNYMGSGVSKKKIVSEIGIFREYELVDNTLKRLKGLPFAHKIMFWLYKVRSYYLLIYLMKLHNRSHNINLEG